MIIKSPRLVPLFVSLGVALLALAGIPCKAATFVYEVTVSGLAASKFYTLDFHFNDGGDGTNNVASITHLTFGTGATVFETPANFTLVDAYPNTQDLDFQTGNVATVSFRLILTKNANVGASKADSFFLSLFDGAGSGGPVLEIKPQSAGDSQVMPSPKPSLTLYGQSVTAMVSAAQPVIAKDFNNDGNADLVFENSVTGQHALWFLNNGAFVSSGSLPIVSAPWHIAGVGDFLGDGQADLVWENTATGQRAIWVLNKGAFVSSISLPTISPQWHIAGAADFLGTLQAGLVWENTVTGQRAIWILKNGVYTSSINLPTVSLQWHIAGAADFLGTGQAGLVWENTVTGQRGIWILKNGVYTSAINLQTISAQWHIAGAADFNGNGQADLVWENTVTGQRAIWILQDGLYMSSLNLPAASTQWRITEH